MLSYFKYLKAFLNEERDMRTRGKDLQKQLSGKLMEFLSLEIFKASTSSCLSDLQKSQAAQKSEV